MAFQTSAAVANAQLDAFETVVGTSARLKIFSGTIPANCAAADGAGTVLADITCPADWAAAAASRSKVLSGSWLDASANATGTAAFFRFYASDGTTCHGQGSVGTSGTIMVVDSVAFVAGQGFTVLAFTLNDNNA